jgi:purine-binding chemotaxis protein CheW
MRDTLAPMGDEDGEGEVREGAGQARSLVAFVLGGELYGVAIQEVTEIREVLPLMPLPHVAPHVLGLSNLRGVVLPVVDLRVRFGLRRAAASPENRLLVLKGPGYPVAILVDSVEGIARLLPSAFQPAPAGVAKIDAEYYRNVATVDGRLLIELDAARMIADTASREARA